MRILFVVHDFLPLHRAGTEIYTFNLASALGRGHKVAVMTTEFRPLARPYSLSERRTAGLRVFEVALDRGYADFGETFLNRRMEGLFRDVLSIWRPSVVHIQHLQNHSFRYPTIARRFGARVFFTLNDYFLLCGHPLGGQMLDPGLRVCEAPLPEKCGRCVAKAGFSIGKFEAAGLRLARSLPRAGGALLSAARAARGAAGLLGGKAGAEPRRPIDPGVIERRIEASRDAAECVDSFISPSRFAAEKHAHHGIGADKTMHVPYGFEKRGFRRVRRPVGERLRLGFVGTVVPHKGLHVLLAAMERLGGEADLAVYGNTGAFPRYSVPLRRRAARLPVAFHGEYEPAQAPEVYAGFDVLVVPSIWEENSPLVIHEAFMSGAPVVASAAGGITELVQDGRNGLLFERGNDAELARKIEGLCRHPAVIERLSAGAPEVEDIDSHARKIERIYEDAAAT